MIFEKMEISILNEYFQNNPIKNKVKFLKFNVIADLTSGQDLTSDRYFENEEVEAIPYLTGASNLQNGKLIINRYTDTPTSIAKKDDILLTCKGTIGEMHILEHEKVHIARQFMAITCKNINIKYMYYFLRMKVPYFLSEGKSIIPGIKRDTLMKLEVPVPEIEEQERIVNKIEELMKKLGELKLIEESLSSLKEKFPEDMKKSFLNKIFRGEIIKHSEENTETLLNSIQEEKNKLISQGLLKKEKPLKEIKEDEIPYTIPKNWRWVRLGDYCQKITDQVASGSFKSLRDNVPSLKTEDYAIMVKTADFSNGFTKNLTYTTEHAYKFLENSNLFGGELILSNIGSIGKVFIVPKLNHKMTLAPNTVMLKMTDERLIKYLYYFIQSPLGYKELMSISSGTAMLKLNKTDLKTLLIPVPPIEEQLKIVEKIEKVLPLVEHIKDMYK